MRFFRIQFLLSISSSVSERFRARAYSRERSIALIAELSDAGKASIDSASSSMSSECCLLLPSVCHCSSPSCLCTSVFAWLRLVGELAGVTLLLSEAELGREQYRKLAASRYEDEEPMAQLQRPPPSCNLLHKEAG